MKHQTTPSWTPILQTITKLKDSSPSPFRIAASGGSSAQIFDQLKEFGFDFSNVDLFQVDERCVSPSHPRSNYNLIATKCGKDVQNFFAFDTTLYPADSAVEYAQQLIEDADGYLFDLTILGVGPDGHIASLFPDSPALCETKKLTAHTTTDVFDIHERLTLTLPALKKSRKILVLLVGEKKRDIWEQIVGYTSQKSNRHPELDSGSPWASNVTPLPQQILLPIHRILPWPQVEVWWVN